MSGFGSLKYEYTGLGNTGNPGPPWHTEAVTIFPAALNKLERKASVL